MTNINIYGLIKGPLAHLVERSAVSRNVAGYSFDNSRQLGVDQEVATMANLIRDYILYK